MLCPVCGQIITQTILPTEVQMLVHRLMKHESPAVQFVTIAIVTAAGGWAIKKVFRA